MKKTFQSGLRAGKEKSKECGKKRELFKERFDQNKVLFGS